MKNASVGIFGVSTAFLIIIAIGGLVAANMIWPGYITNGLQFLFAAPQPCGENPYDEDCLCTVDEERQEVNYVGPRRYFCEPVNKFIDPDVAGYETTAESYVEGKLQELFPACGMATCEQAGASWRIGTGYEEYFWRDISAECVSDEGLFTFATIDVDPVTGAISDAGCADYDQVVQATTSANPISIDFQRKSFAPSGILQNVNTRAFLRAESHCGDRDNGVGYVTVRSDLNVANWNVPSTWDVAGFKLADLRVVESSNDYVTIEVDTNCPHSGLKFDWEITGDWEEGVCKGFAINNGETKCFDVNGGDTHKIVQCTDGVSSDQATGLTGSCGGVGS